MIDVGVLFEQAVAALGRERHATYRLQLGGALGFDAVAALAPYLDALGVNDAYLSPCLRRGPGSSHGYDVTDHNAFNPEVGSAATFELVLRLIGEGKVTGLRVDHPDGLYAPGEYFAEVLEHWPAGRVKLYLTHRALTLRRRRARLFRVGEYRALTPAGRQADHVVAFARLDGADAAIVAVPRLTARRAGLTGRFALGEAAWEQTWVALGDEQLAGVYRDRFTGLRVASPRHDGGAALPAAALFGHFPVALLEREGARP